MELSRIGDLMYYVVLYEDAMLRLVTLQTSASDVSPDPMIHMYATDISHGVHKTCARIIIRVRYYFMITTFAEAILSGYKSNLKYFLSDIIY